MNFRQRLLEFRGMSGTAPQSLPQTYGLRSGKPNREFEIAAKARSPGRRRSGPWSTPGLPQVASKCPTYREISHLNRTCFSERT